jgi:phenylalanyl-tRNA synthetase beta chain
MTLSYNWLMEYLPEPIALPELSAILTRIGLEVEGTETSGTDFSGMDHFVVGKVQTCIQHPNAERLKLTTVDTGTGTVSQIVCGAPNVHEGATVIVALPGAVITPKEGVPFTIKKSKLRGEVSEGMLCSAAELGISDDASGLLLLDASLPAGLPAADAFPKTTVDTAIFIGLTPNRSDAASHMGTARDICAYQSYHTGRNWTVQMPQTAVLPEANATRSIVNEAPQQCFRYAALTLENIQVTESPEWLRERLQTIGVRSINNVVDVTNYVLHETGHPLHAFDAAKLSGTDIRIRTAQAGERFVTLDGNERTLHPNDLLICDAEKPVALAGVMGGKESGVSDQTTSVVLECAVFSPSTVRNTSLRYGLRSDAATHFEKGVDFDDTPFVLARALALLQDVSGATASGATDVHTQTPTLKTISLSVAQVQQLSGKNYAAEAIEGILQALGFEIEPDDSGTSFSVSVPTYKTDISLPADLVEEIVRIDGLDEIALPEHLRLPRLAARPNDRALKEKAARLLAGMGFHEILTNSIINSRWFPQESRLITMCNALSSELDALRPSMLQSGLVVLEYNLNRKVPGMALFELGTVYHKGEGGNEYIETPQLALWVCGSLTLANWKKETLKPDVYWLKGIVENILTTFGVATESHTENGAMVFRNGETELARVETVSAQTAAAFGVKEPVLFAQIQWRLLTGAATASKVRFRELPKLPFVERDLALVVDAALSYEALERVTRQEAPATLQRFQLFDVFQNEKLGEGKKSLAIRYRFQPLDQTPTDAEIDGWMQNLIAGYQNALGATIRL